MTTAPVPIHVTAREPVEYIPTPQDAERYERLKRLEIQHLERRLAGFVEQRRAADARANEGKPDAHRRTSDKSAEEKELEKQIEDEIGFMQRNLRTMAEIYPQPQRFLLQVPTSVEREQINSRLVGLGLTQVTTEIMRATMIEELWKEDWGVGGVGTTENDAVADDTACFLDSVWLRTEAHTAATEAWQEQFQQQIMDESHGAPPRARQEQPPAIISIRDNARQTRLIDRMMNSSQALRDLAARAADVGRIQAVLMARAHILAVDGIEGLDVVVQRDPRTNALPEATVLALREKVDDTSWADLIAYIDRMYKLDGGEVKNSVSPLERPPRQDGSTEPTGDRASSDGSSTISSTTAAPAGGSGTIIEPSSSSSVVSIATPPMERSGSLMDVLS